MKNRQSRVIPFLLASAAWMMPLVGAARAEEFNNERLRAGQEAYLGKRYEEAIDQFRLAAFGSLDKPVVLSECLAWLALAEAADGKSARADATLERFLDIERRFGVYAQADLQPEIRSAFQALLLRRVAPASILSVPSLAPLIDTEEHKILKLAPADRRKALEAAARREPGNPRWPIVLSREALERGDPKDAERWAGKALAIQSGNSEALALRARARLARGEFEDALKDLAALPPDEFEKRPELYADDFVGLVETRNWTVAREISRHIPETLSNRADVVRARDKLTLEEQRASRETGRAGGAAPPTSPAPGPPAPAKPVPSPADTAAKSKDALAEARRLVAAGKAQDAGRLLSEAIKRDPGNRDLRLALLEAACLSRAYQLGAAQIPLVTPFGESESPSIFYASVLLYETGKTDEARKYLERALPNVSGQLVNEYSKKILAQP